MPLYKDATGQRDRRPCAGDIVDTMTESRSNGAREGGVPFFAMASKIVVFLLPSLVLEQTRFSKNHLAIASSWVAGALLQALIPPARKGLFPILGLALVVGTVYVIYGRF
jgi:hypothetical protein